MKNFRILVLTVTLCFLQTSCQFYVQGHAQPSRNTESRTPASATTKPAQPHDKLINPEVSAFESTVRDEFGKENYKWIEQEAARLRQTRERFPGGYWKLRAIYLSIESPVEGDAASDDTWLQHIHKLEAWVKMHPQSITARVALANAWQSYGWKARGHGFSDTVNEQGANAFQDRQEKAEQILQGAESLTEKCPHLYVTLLTIETGVGWDGAKAKALFEKGIALEPTYYYLHQAMAIALLPRWFGEPGEWESFAERSADHIGGEQGDILLFEIYSHMMTMHGLDFWNTHQEVTPRLLRGFRAIEKLYGADAHRLNAACQMSFFANDPKTSEELMNRIGDDFDESVWRSKTNFEVFRQGAKQIAARKGGAETPSRQNPGSKP